MIHGDLKDVPTERLIELSLRRGTTRRDHWEPIIELGKRTGRQDLLKTEALAPSSNWFHRKVCAEVFGHYKVSKEKPRSVERILIRLLRDPDHRVIAASANSLWAGKCKRAITTLAALRQNRHAIVRYAVAGALFGLDEPLALETLVALASDTARTVRLCATFGLGSMGLCNSPNVVAALVKNVGDKDSMIVGEALLGLVWRKHPDIVNLTSMALTREAVDRLTLDAAAEVRDSVLLPKLLELKKRFKGKADERYFQSLNHAIVMCS